MSHPATPDHRPGDVVNGHVLVQHPDGSMTWEPMTTTPAPERPAKAAWWKRKRIIIPTAVLVGLVAIAGIGNAVRQPAEAGGVAHSTADAGPSERAEPTESAEPTETEPEKAIVPDVTGKTVAEAVTVLRTAGFTVDDPADGSMIVTSTTPGTGGIAEAGTKVIITAEAPKPQLALEQANAVKQAEQYLEFMPFSRQGLIDQLSSEYGSGYPVDVATFAVDYVNPDWNAEAAEAAKSYLDTMAFSRDGLYEQLTSEYGGQFTPEQASAGLAAVGY